MLNTSIDRNAKNLPVPTPWQMAKFYEAAAARAERKNPDMLIVEDQAFWRIILFGVLCRPYKIHAAADAAEAWEAYLEHAPDICFLDIELPDINGHRLAKAIRALDPAAFIVMVTGNNNAADVQQALESGTKGFIVKPYNRQKILDVIQKFEQESRG